MGGPSRARERQSHRSSRLTWLAGAISILSIAPACASDHGGAEAAPSAGATGSVGIGTAGTTGTGDVAATNGGAAAGATGDVAGSMSASEPPSCAGDAEFSGTYTVPVPAELEPYASYDVSSIHFCMREGSVGLSYDLPELLVGDSVGLDLRGPFVANESGIELTGDLGTASCSAAGATWSCRENLDHLSIQRDKLAKRLDSLPAPEAQGRSSVADVFSQDPIGVLTFTTP